MTQAAAVQPPTYPRVLHSQQAEPIALARRARIFGRHERQPASARALAAVSASAGKKHSMRTSCAVMSCGEPSVATTEK